MKRAPLFICLLGFCLPVTAQGMKPGDKTDLLIDHASLVDGSKIQMDQVNRGQHAWERYPLTPGEHITAEYLGMTVGPNGEELIVWAARRAHKCGRHCDNELRGVFITRRKYLTAPPCECEVVVQLRYRKPGQPPPTPPAPPVAPPGEQRILTWMAQPVSQYDHQGMPVTRRQTSVQHAGFRLRDRISAIGQGGSASSSSTSSATASAATTSVSGGSGGSNPPVTAAGSGGTAAPGP